jgi:UDP-N-acetyl-2-amino-2-deoxyglucuronate dehydrogenase
MYNVGIIGCGAIFNRHVLSIKENKNFKLVSICDIDKNLVEDLAKNLNVKAYTDYKEMAKDKDVNFIVIASPNYYHYEQSIFCLKNKCDVLIEKPVSFKSIDIDDISRIAKEYNQKAFCVLQVRLNNSVAIVKETLSKKLLGELRGVSFVQRWQRPYEYFSGWRNSVKIGGGTLYEVGIHYLDVLQMLFGMPQIIATKTYKTKHKLANVEDTVYSLLDFGKFGGTAEITVSAEPKNLECSIQIMGSNGYLKIGGKALNVIETYNFLSNGSQVKFEQILEDFNKENNDFNDYGSYLGSCPNHTDVYKNIEKFSIEESKLGIELIEKIYKKAGIHYGN